MQDNLPKIAKIYQNLPKNETLKYHQKLRFWCFSKKKKSTCRGGTRACFHHLDFQSKNFSYANFIVKKRPLYVNFSIPLCGNDFFGNPPQLWWIWDFAHIYLTQIRTRIWSPATHIYVRKWLFWPPKHCCPSRGSGKKLFLQLWILWFRKR
jgi:hypothetical protein